MSSFTESSIEQAAMEWLKDLGYSYAFAGAFCTLASLRDTLLPKLMRGEVRVKL
jgi:hypothetical protein